MRQQITRFTMIDSQPERVTGPLAREAAQMKPRLTNNSDQFEAMGEKWCTRYEQDVEPVKPSTPDVMKGYYSVEDSQKMLDADMIRRRRKFQTRLSVLRTTSNIPREG